MTKVFSDYIEKGIWSWEVVKKIKKQAVVATPEAEAGRSLD
jgi:hypothetical protein